MYIFRVFDFLVVIIILFIYFVGLFIFVRIFRFFSWFSLVLNFFFRVVGIWCEGVMDGFVFLFIWRCIVLGRVLRFFENMFVWCWISLLVVLIFLMFLCNCFCGVGIVMKLFWCIVISFICCVVCVFIRVVNLLGMMINLMEYLFFVLGFLILRWVILRGFRFVLFYIFKVLFDGCIRFLVV